MKKAADGNRTRDLRTTNATHYRLCYSSLYKASQTIYKAADGNRTRDLRTTNATHYRLCYSSLFSCLRLLATVKYTTITPRKCQLLFSNFFCFLISTFNSVFGVQFHKPEHRLPQKHSGNRYHLSWEWKQCNRTSLLPDG